MTVVGDPAIRFLAMLLGEHGIRCSEVQDMRTLTAIVVTRDDEASIAVDSALTPAQKIVQYLHCYAHIVRGDIQPTLGVRLEYADAERGHLAPEFRQQEEEADAIVDTWLVGRQLPPALVPIINHSTGTGRCYSILERAGRRFECSSFAQSLGFSSVVGTLRNMLRERQRTLSLRQLQRAGQGISAPHRPNEVVWPPEPAVRAHRVEVLVGSVTASSDGGSEMTILDDDTTDLSTYFAD